MFAYLRVTGNAQIDGDGFPRQLEAINCYAQQHDLRIAKVYREEAVCGATESTNRPAWAEMISNLNGVKTVLIECLNRLARDVMVQEHIIHDLRERPIDLVSVTEPDLCRDDPTRNLLRQTMGAIAECDRCMIVQKLRGARQRMKAKTGRCEGRRPYGSRNGEPVVIARMQARRTSGLTFDAMADHLNAEGVSTRAAGKLWCGRVVGRILERAASAAQTRRDGRAV